MARNGRDIGSTLRDLLDGELHGMIAAMRALAHARVEADGDDDDRGALAVAGRCVALVETIEGRIDAAHERLREEAREAPANEAGGPAP